MQVLPHLVPAATSTIIVSTAVSTVVSIANQAHAPLIKPPSLASTSTTRVYSSPKGNEAVNAAKASSIPVKTRDQADWSVRVWSRITQNDIFFSRT